MTKKEQIQMLRMAQKNVIKILKEMPIISTKSTQAQIKKLFIWYHWNDNILKEDLKIIGDTIKSITYDTYSLSENPFKSLKVTAQKPTNQKPIKRYKKCI